MTTRDAATLGAAALLLTPGLWALQHSAGAGMLAERSLHAAALGAGLFLAGSALLGRGPSRRGWKWAALGLVAALLLARGVAARGGLDLSLLPWPAAPGSWSLAAGALAVASGAVLAWRPAGPNAGVLGLVALVSVGLGLAEPLGPVAALPALVGALWLGTRALPAGAADAGLGAAGGLALLGVLGVLGLEEGPGWSAAPPEARVLGLGPALGGALVLLLAWTRGRA